MKHKFIALALTMAAPLAAFPATCDVVFPNEPPVKVVLVESKGVQVGSVESASWKANGSGGVVKLRTDDATQSAGVLVLLRWRSFAAQEVKTTDGSVFQVPYQNDADNRIVAPYGMTAVIELPGRKGVERLTVACTASTANAGGAYEAGTADTDLKKLVWRWASMDGKKLIWQAEGNAQIKDVDSLNGFAKLNHVKTFNEALTGLNRELERTFNDQTRAYPPRPLHACVFDDAIVIRTLDQPECSKSL